MLESLDLTGKLVKAGRREVARVAQVETVVASDPTTPYWSHDRIAAGPRGGGAVDPCSCQEITVGGRESSCLFGLIVRVHVSQANQKSEL
jgi:hypothetical protein